MAGLAPLLTLPIMAIPTTGLGAFLTKTLIYAGTTAMAQATMPSPTVPQIPRGIEIQQNSCALNCSLDLNYGQIRRSGNDVFYFTHGDKNKYLWIVEVYGEGECEGIAQNDDSDPKDLVFINDELLAGSQYEGLVSYTFYNGTSDQTYDTDLNAVCPDWTDNQRGTCYMVWKFTYSAAKFPSIPRRQIVLKGRKVWIPGNTKEYSNNAAAVLYDFMKSPHCAAALGWPEEDMLLTDEIDYYSYQAAYNYCASKGWEYNGIVTADERLGDVIDRIRKHFRGAVRPTDGVFYFHYRDLNEESICMALTDDHIARDDNGKAMISITPTGLVNKADSLRVSFVNPTDDRYFEDFAIIGEEEEDIRNVDLPGFTSKEKAGAMGSYILERNRDPYDRIISGIFRDDCQQLEKEDLITLTCTAFGYSEQYMRITGTKRLSSGLIKLDMQLEHTDLYNDTYDVATESSYTCTLPDKNNFDPVTQPERYVELADEDFDSNSEYQLETSDLNKVYVIDSNNDLTVLVPAGDSDQLGSKIKFKHYGTGKFSVQAAGTNTIDNSSAGGSIYHEQSGISQEGSIELQLAKSTHWAVNNVLGPWFTDAADELFLHTALFINDKTFGNQGVQADFNSGLPRIHCGDGADAFIKHDGTKLTWKAVNTELDASGNLTCTGGTIGGFTLAVTTLTATNLLIDAGNQEIKLGSGNDIISLDAADATYRLAIGHATYASAPFRVTKAGAVTATSGTIGGFTLAATTQSCENITLDAGNDRIVCNTITIDGANDRIRSSNYVSGSSGAGFTVEPDLIEAGNLAARGILRMAVFQKDAISAIGGNLLCSKGSDVLAEDLEDDSEEMVIKGNETFAVGDILRIKDDTDDEWFEVTDVSSDQTTYNVTRDKADAYGSSESSFAGLPEWKKGATVVNYGASGDGLIHITASEANAPFISVFTHAGEPWDALTTRARMGNLNGYLGYSSDIYGIGIGTTDSFIKCDPTNGIQIQVTTADAIVIKAGGDIKLEAAADPGKIKFVGSVDTTTIGSLNVEGTEFRFVPGIADSTAFRIGTSTYYYTSFYTYARHQELITYDTESFNGYIELDSENADDATYIRFMIKSTTERSLIMYNYNGAATLYFGPEQQDVWDLGRASYEWNNIFANTITLVNTGLHIKDTNNAFYISIKPGSVLAANRILTLTTGDADRTLTISGNATIDEKTARVKTISYTGNGSTSKGITGVGFTPKYVKIIYYFGDGGASVIVETTTELMARDAQGMALYSDPSSFMTYDNRIITLDADGFTVSDDGSDAHPNKNGATYDCICLG